MFLFLIKIVKVRAVRHPLAYIYNIFDPFRRVNTAIYRLVPPPTLTAQPKKCHFSQTRRECRHSSLVSTLGVTQCDSLPPLQVYNTVELRLLELG